MGAEEVVAVVDRSVMVPSMGRESLGVSLEVSLGWREAGVARAAEVEGEGAAVAAAAPLSLSLFLGCFSWHHHVDHHWDLRSSFSLRRSRITFMFPWASTTQRKPRGGRLYVNDPGGWPADQRLCRELREKIPTTVLLPKGDLFCSGPGNLYKTSH